MYMDIKLVWLSMELKWTGFFFFSLLCNLSFGVGLSKNASVHLPLVIWDLTGLHMVQSIQLATQSSFQSNYAPILNQPSHQDWLLAV